MSTEPDSLLQEKVEIQIYECFALMKSDTRRNLTEIQNEIRSVCGITIVNSEPTEVLSLHKQKTRLKIKFISLKSTLRESIEDLINRIRRIDGVYSFQVRKVRKLVLKV